MLFRSGNMRGSERYRRHLARELGRRAIRVAAGLDPIPASMFTPAPRTVCSGDLHDAEGPKTGEGDN